MKFVSLSIVTMMHSFDKFIFYFIKRVAGTKADLNTHMRDISKWKLLIPTCDGKRQIEVNFDCSSISVGWLSLCQNSKMSALNRFFIVYKDFQVLTVFQKALRSNEMENGLVKFTEWMWYRIKISTACE